MPSYCLNSTHSIGDNSIQATGGCGHLMWNLCELITEIIRFAIFFCDHVGFRIRQSKPCHLSYKFKLIYRIAPNKIKYLDVHCPKKPWRTFQRNGMNKRGWRGGCIELIKEDLIHAKLIYFSSISGNLLRGN